jgi:prepilin-type N-terminal cleavage/methylation domain-containing protein
MNMILKKQLAHRRGHPGFTLVEVIVVLVILAILAAIAIPALTGYIDKAEWAGLESKVRIQRMAVQTIIDERYARDGGFKNLAPQADRTDDIFVGIQKSTVVGTSVAFEGFTVPGIEEYENLTGDAESFDETSSQSRIFGCWTDFSGSIKGYHYVARNYFGAGATLDAYYIPDLDATDPVTTGLRNFWKNQTNGVENMSSGFNVFKHSGGSYEKLN